ncbi:olfactory receptor 52N2-like [Sinocyclocheilus anshuiensis]|uniref:olfactory receptor 52N2-like n=1 Tax=Sinocyclocheilus anshuiensis TaxID=1608454 RepID=UPI0007B8FDA1|nr:PREDICTED: olfactory receptor 52N2-like [Sinocyclocheilus anshuiensis]
MDNLTFRYSILLMEGLQVKQQSLHSAIQISVEKSLHQPMHILFCNLPLNHVLGTTILLPHLMRNTLTDTSEHYITYVECVMQAFFGHLYGTASHTILMIGLSVRLSHCRSFIENPFCDNASLFKLSCESTVINNVYGLTFTVVLLTSSLGSMVLTYLRIAMVCFKSKNKASNSKAIKTSRAHLAVYVIMMVSGFTTILLHRFPELSEHRKLSSIMFHVVPPCLNPIIYGLQAKEIRQKLFKLMYKSKVNFIFFFSVKEIGAGITGLDSAAVSVPDSGAAGGSGMRT